jgi:cell division septum initiation protein DivIVA
MSTVTSAHELKGYQSQLAKAKADAEVAKQAADAAQREATAAANKVSQLEQKIASLQQAAAEPIVSEHALLRWLERVEGLCLDSIRAHILADGTAAAIQFAKTGRIKKQGYTLVVKNNTVVTVE